MARRLSLLSIFLLTQNLLMLSLTLAIRFLHCLVIACLLFCSVKLQNHTYPIQKIYRKSKIIPKLFVNKQFTHAT